jgi:hypothetical protein
MSEDTKVIVIVLLLLFVPPVGAILMLLWTDWPVWLKVLLSIYAFAGLFLLLFLFVMGFLLLGTLGFAASMKELQETECKNACLRDATVSVCQERCMSGSSQLTASSSPRPLAYNSALMLVELNQARRNNPTNSTQLQSDVNLCAYANRLIDKMINENMNYSEMFKEDVNNRLISAKYFKDYSRMYQSDARASVYADSILPSTFTDLGSNAMTPRLKAGCFAVRPSTTSSEVDIVFVGGL